jgi:cytochrome c553
MNDMTIRKTAILTKASLGTAALLLISMGVSSSNAADVAANWNTHCASCHGKTGKGDTKAGKKADVKDLTDAKVQEMFTDDQMFKQIKEGMKDKNGKEKMKAFGGTLSDDEIKALVAHVRTLKK